MPGRRLHRPKRGRCRRADAGGLGHHPASVVPAGIRLGDRLHLHRDADAPCAVRNVLGGNASFRREVFDKVGGFISGIGRGQGTRPLGCEETEFCIRLRQQIPGSVLLFDEQAMIWHRVRESGAASPTTAPLLRRGPVEGDGDAHVGRPRTVCLPSGVRQPDPPARSPPGLADALHGDIAGFSRAGPSWRLAAVDLGYPTGSGTAVGSVTARLRWWHRRPCRGQRPGCTAAEK